MLELPKEKVEVVDSAHAAFYCPPDLYEKFIDYLTKLDPCLGFLEKGSITNTETNKSLCHIIELKLIDHEKADELARDFNVSI